MAMIDINRNPSKRDLVAFGFILLAFFALVGSLVLWRVQSLLAALSLWSLGAGFVTGYFAVRPLRRPIYLGWMAAVSPLGWLLSHVLLGAVFFLVLTPIGFMMQLCGQDPMQRKFDEHAPSYWVPRKADPNPGRYFRQF